MSNKKGSHEDEQQVAVNVGAKSHVATKKGSTAGLILLIIIIASFVGAPLFSIMLGGGFNQFQFGKYASRSVAYTQGSQFARMVEQRRNDYASLLSGPYAYPMLESIVRDAFQQAMIAEAWIYESQRAGVLVSSEEVARLLRSQGLTDSRIAAMSVVERSEYFKQQEQAAKIARFQSGALDNVVRDQQFMNFLLNPVQNQRSVELYYMPYTQISDVFLMDYTAQHSVPLQKWQLRRYIHIGDAKSAEAVASELAAGNSTITDLALAQSESDNTPYRDAYAEAGGLMPLQLLYQIQQQGDLSIEELHQELSSLSTGRASKAIAFTAAPYGLEAYVFYQVEALPQVVDLANTADRDAVIAYLSAFDQTTVEQYFNNLKDENPSNVAGLQRVSSDYFSMVYGLDMKGGYSPYKGLITSFEGAFPGLDTATIKAISDSKEFFIQAFNTPLNNESSVILLPAGATWLTPTSEEQYQSATAEIDTFYMEQFLRMQGQLSMEEAFRTSSRYRDGKFEKAFAFFAKQSGIISPQ